MWEKPENRQLKKLCMVTFYLVLNYCIEKPDDGLLRPKHVAVLKSGKYSCTGRNIIRLLLRHLRIYTILISHTLYYGCSQ
jgi:hypothetical protein